MSGIVVKHTKLYIYLGSPFTENGNINTVINLHMKSRTKDLNKFKIFCKKNETMPYILEKKVLEAVIISSVKRGYQLTSKK